MFHKFLKDLSVPATASVVAASAIIGNPLSSVYTAAQLSCAHEIVTLFLQLEADVAAKGFELLEVIPASTILETFFVADYNTFAASGLQQTWSAYNSNLEVVFAERRYKLGKPGVNPSYMKIEVGMKGVAATASATSHSARPFCTVSFYTTDNFSSEIGRRSFSLNNTASYISNASTAYVTKIGYMFNENNLAIYPMGYFTLATSINANIAGRVQGFSMPNHFVHGFVISLVNAYSPLTPVEKQIAALLPPQFNTITTGNATPGATVFSVNNTYVYSDGACAIALGTKEYRGVAVPPCDSGLVASAAPSRMFISPYTHVLKSGAVLSFDGLFWLSDPSKDRLDFVESQVQIAGELREISILPNLMPTVNSTALWDTTIGQYVLGLTK